MNTTEEEYKEHRRIIRQRYYKNNREEINERKKAYREANKEKIKANKKPSFFRQLEQTNFFDEYIDPNDNTKYIYENRQRTKLGLYIHLFRELKIYSKDDFIF